MLPNFKIAARGQLQKFLWVQKSEIIQILLSHSTRYGESVRIHIVQSHYPPSGNAHVILLKFKMAATN